MAVTTLEIIIESNGAECAKLEDTSGEHPISKESGALPEGSEIDEIGDILIGTSVVLHFAQNLENPAELFRREADGEDETMVEVEDDSVELQAGDRLEIGNVTLRVKALEFDSEAAPADEPADEVDPTEAPAPNPTLVVAEEDEEEDPAESAETTPDAPLGADEEVPGSEDETLSPDEPVPGSEDEVAEPAGTDTNLEPEADLADGTDTNPTETGGDAGEENPMNIDDDPIAAAIGGAPIEDPDEELEEGDEGETSQVEPDESPDGDELEEAARAAEELEAAQAQVEEARREAAAEAQRQADVEAARLREETERAEEEAQRQRLAQAGPPVLVPPPGVTRTDGDELEEARAEAARQAEEEAARLREEQERAAAEVEELEARAQRAREARQADEDRAAAARRQAAAADQRRHEAEQARQAPAPVQQPPAPDAAVPPPPGAAPAPAPTNRESGGGTSGWLIAAVFLVALMALGAMGLGVLGIMTAVNGDARLAKDLPPTSVQLPASADSIMCTGDGASMTHNGRMGSTGQPLYTGRVSVFVDPGQYDVYSFRNVTVLSDGTCGGENGGALTVSSCMLTNVGIRAKADSGCNAERTLLAVGKAVVN